MAVMVILDPGLLVTAVPADLEVLLIQVVLAAAEEDMEQEAEADHIAAVVVAQVAATAATEITTPLGTAVEWVEIAAPEVEVQLLLVQVEGMAAV